MSEEKPTITGRDSRVRGKSKTGNKNKYIHRIIVTRDSKNNLIREPVSNHAPNVMGMMQMRMVERESSRTLRGA